MAERKKPGRSKMSVRSQRGQRTQKKIVSKTQEQNLVIDPKAVIDGFCWAYCKALADELERLLKTGEVWYTPDQMSLSDQGELIVRRLRGQILRTVPPPDVPLNDDASEELALIDLLTEARKFLAVFEKK